MKITLLRENSNKSTGLEFLWEETIYTKYEQRLDSSKSFAQIAIRILYHRKENRSLD